MSKTKLLEMPGLIRGESNEDYHGNDAVSRSGVKDFEKRPSFFYKKHVLRSIKTEETAAMKIGTASHTLILEGEEVFEKQYEVLPHDFNGRTNDGKGLIAQIEADGKVAIKHTEYRDLVEYRESVLANPFARALLAQGEPELGWRLKGEYYDTQCRSDWYCHNAPDFSALRAEYPEMDNFLPAPGEPYDVDFKTTQSLDDWVADGWNNTIAKFGYDEQLVFYRAVQNIILKAAEHPAVDKFYFVVTEKQEPRETAVFLIDAGTLAAAHARLMETLNRLNECYRTGKWPGFRSDIIETGISERVRDTRALDAINSRRMLNEPLEA